jgi:uncharacterized protein (TIGR03083 family)
VDARRHNDGVPTLDAARSTYVAAAEAFVGLVTDVPRERYAGPGLGDWDLRSLVGHTGRSFVTVATYLTTRAAGVAAPSPSAYFTVVARLVTDEMSAAIHQRGVDAGHALGDDPVATLRGSYAAALDAIDRLQGQDPVVETAAGGMRVSDYLPTRTFELTVHALDVARALGVGFEPPPAALAATLRIAADAAVEQGLGVEVVLALTGRAALPAGRSVVP